MGRMLRQHMQKESGHVSRAARRLLLLLADDVLDYATSPGTAREHEHTARTVAQIHPARLRRDWSVEWMADELGVQRAAIQVALRELRGHGVIESEVRGPYEGTRTRLVIPDIAAVRLRRSRRTAILTLEHRTGWYPSSGTDVDTPTHVVVDALIEQWRAAHPPTLRGHLLRGARIPDDAIADALPVIVAGLLGVTEPAFDVPNADPDLPEGADASLWGERAPKVDHDAEARTTAVAAVEAHYQARGVRHYRAVTTKTLEVLRRCGMGPGAVTAAVLAGRFAAVDVRVPSDVTRDSLAAVHDDRAWRQALRGARAAAGDERDEHGDRAVPFAYPPAGAVPGMGRVLRDAAAGIAARGHSTDEKPTGAEVGGEPWSDLAWDDEPHDEPWADAA